MKGTSPLLSCSIVFVRELGVSQSSFPFVVVGVDPYLKGNKYSPTSSDTYGYLQISTGIFRYLLPINTILTN